MSFLAVTPINQGNGSPPPPPAAADASDIGGVGSDEGALIREALSELDGGAEATPEVQQQTQQPKPAEKKPEEELTQRKLSNGFAKLAAQERRLEVDREQFKAERASFEAERAEIAPLKEAMQKAKTSPLEALQAIGWSYKQLVDYVMADGQIPQEKLVERLTNEHKSNYERVQSELEQIKQQRQQEQERYEAQQDMSRIEHQTRSLFNDGAEGLTKFPTFAYHFKKSPETAQKLLQDVQNLRARHFNETCVRDQKTGQIIRPGEIVDALPAVAYIERILADMQMSAGNPGQPGAVPQTANAGAERQPKPLTPRDSSVTSMPSDEELAKMTDEEIHALSLRVLNGG